ncbi:MAG TPA: hypothetical protein VLH79_07520 [Chthonomonadales bacterium]|nr:hypothetical protein [Chthonomonadales bacterium]
MTVLATIAKAGPYAGAGTTGPFTVPFRFLDAAHLRVIRSVGNVETVLALGADYTVNGVGASSGSVTLLAPLPVGQSLTVVRNVPATQEADYVPGDAFPAESHEQALDKLTMITQQLQEEVQRAAKLPASSPSDADALSVALLRVDANSSNINAVNANSANINAAVANSANINTVAGSIGNVNTVGGNIASVNAVAGINADVSAVGAVASDIPTVAANVADVKNFADVWQGAKSTTPTLRNNGSALQAGDQYFDLVLNEVRVYTGAVWMSAGLTNGVYTTGDQTIGGVKTFSSPPVVPNDSFSFAQLQNIPTATILGRATAGTGDVEALTGAQATALLSAASETVSGRVELADATEATAGTDGTRALSPLRLRNALAATGSAPIYACRAWVNFNGTGTVAIRASGNVSSITDNGTGDYTVNLTTAMPDANYAAVATGQNDVLLARTQDTVTARTTTTLRVAAINTAFSATDSAQISVAIFR